MGCVEWLYCCTDFQHMSSCRFQIKEIHHCIYIIYNIQQPDYHEKNTNCASNNSVEEDETIKIVK